MQHRHVTPPARILILWTGQVEDYETSTAGTGSHPQMATTAATIIWLAWLTTVALTTKTYGGWAFGVRPIVTLKSGVKTNETADTEFLGQTCWALK